MPERTQVGQNGRSPIFEHLDTEGNVWVLDNPISSGLYPGWENTTFRGTGPNLGSQATYDPSGVLIDFGPYMGTSDYFPPGPFGSGEHTNFDVIPHSDNPIYTPNISTRF